MKSWTNIWQSTRPADGKTRFVQHFAQHPLFAELTVAELRSLFDLGHERSYRSGESVFGAGEIGHAAYFVLQGEAKVGPEANSVHLGVGEVLGITGILGHSARETDVVAVGDLQCVALLHADLMHWGDRYPRAWSKILLHLGRIMAARWEA